MIPAPRYRGEEIRRALGNGKDPGTGKWTITLYLVPNTLREEVVTVKSETDYWEFLKSLRQFVPAYEREGIHNEKQPG